MSKFNFFTDNDMKFLVDYDMNSLLRLSDKSIFNYLLNNNLDYMNLIDYIAKINIIKCKINPNLKLTKRFEYSNVELPPKLSTAIAMTFWKLLQDAKLITKDYQLAKGVTNKEAVYIADLFSNKLGISKKWVYFEQLWGINNMASINYKNWETEFEPRIKKIIDMIFE